MRLQLAAALAATACSLPALGADFILTMSGDQEVPGPGDPDGTASGTLTIDPDTNTITWNFVYADITTPSMMHIHTGAAGVSGPVLVNLGVATTGGPGTLVEDTVASAAAIATILADPQGFYVNIHNANFPAGAVRGQLVPAPTPCPGDLDGSGAVDGGDLGVLLAAWGTNDPAADLDGSGTVDGADLGALLAAWGDCP